MLPNAGRHEFTFTPEQAAKYPIVPNAESHESIKRPDLIYWRPVASYDTLGARDSIGLDPPHNREVQILLTAEVAVE